MFLHQVDRELSHRRSLNGGGGFGPPHHVSWDVPENPGSWFIIEVFWGFEFGHEQKRSTSQKKTQLSLDIVSYIYIYYIHSERR